MHEGSSHVELPQDEVCKIPDADPRFVRLIYYDPLGEHTFEKRVPIGVHMADQQVDLLREGRAWFRSSRLRLVKPTPTTPFSSSGS